jgi:hypothetical protein
MRAVCIFLHGTCSRCKAILFSATSGSAHTGVVVYKFSALNFAHFSCAFRAVFNALKDAGNLHFPARHMQPL